MFCCLPVEGWVDKQAIVPGIAFSYFYFRIIQNPISVLVEKKKIYIIYSANVYRSVCVGGICI